MAAGAVLNVVLSLVLIPVYAETGVAIAATVSLIVSNGAMTLAARRKLGIDSTALGWSPSSVHT